MMIHRQTDKQIHVLFLKLNTSMNSPVEKEERKGNEDINCHPEDEEEEVGK